MFWRDFHIGLFWREQTFHVTTITPRSLHARLAQAFILIHPYLNLLIFTQHSTRRTRLSHLLTMAKSAGSAFTGGKLSLKGDKTKPKKKSMTSKPKLHGKIDESDNTSSASANSAGRRSHPDDSRVETNKNIHDNNSSDDEDLTAAEKRSRKFKQQRERKELEQVVRCV